jgi:hypothetical protein
VVDDLRVRPLHQCGVGQLHELDPHLGPLLVQLPFEIFPSVGPVLGEVLLNPVGPNGVDDRARWPARPLSHTGALPARQAGTP